MALSWLRTLPAAIRDNRPDWRAGIASWLSRTEANARAFAATLELVMLGYLLDDVTSDAVVPLCPELPVSRRNASP